MSATDEAGGPSGAAGRADESAAHILVVDDLPANTRVASRVLDAIGREVLRQEHGDYRTGVMTIDLSKHAAGIYFVQLLLDEQTVTKKINLTKR